MKTCAILCSGPTARQFDLTKIKVPKIGVNWSFLFLESDIHVWTSATLIRQQGANYEELTPTAEPRFSALPVGGAFTPKVIAKINNVNDKTPYKIPKGYDIYEDGWVLAGGSGCALQVAVSSGFDNIVFVGLDLIVAADFHCFSNESETGIKIDERSGHTKPQAAKSWVLQTIFLSRVKKGLEEQGIRVSNLGASNVFDLGDFQELIGG